MENQSRLCDFLVLISGLHQKPDFPHLVAEGWGAKNLSCRLAMVVVGVEDFEVFERISRCYFAMIEAEEYFVMIPCRILDWPDQGPGHFQLATRAAEIDLLFVMAATSSDRGGYCLKPEQTPEGREWNLSIPPTEMRLEPELYDLFPHNLVVDGALLQTLQLLVKSLDQRIAITIFDGERNIST